MPGKKYESYINLSPDALLAMRPPPPPKLKRTKRSFGIPVVDDGNGNNTTPNHLQYKVNGIVNEQVNKEVKRIIKRPLARPRRKGDTKKLINITGKRRSKTKNRTRTRTRSKSRSRSRSRSRSGSGSGNKKKKM